LVQLAIQPEEVNATRAGVQEKGAFFFGMRCGTMRAGDKRFARRDDDGQL
jgi:hypothetical protein